MASPERRRHGSDRDIRDRAGYERSLPTVARRSREHHGGVLGMAVADLGRGETGGQRQADLSAEQPTAGQGPWFPVADAHPGGPSDRHGPASQRPAFAYCLIGDCSVLPAKYRMTRSAEFGVTVRQGVRAAQPDLVVHARRDWHHPDGPRIGLVVSKSVGNAVDRHRVARRLRHAAAEMIDDLAAEDRIVIRALPGSRHAISARLRHELACGLRRARDLMERSR